MGEHESLNAALIECVKCCGGSKQVGLKLWPEKTVDAAQRHLLACLNEDKPERLNPEQLVLLMRMGRDRGCHDAMRYIAASLGYAEPVPTDPRDELAELLRQHIELQTATLKSNERLQRAIESQPTAPPRVRSVA